VHFCISIFIEIAQKGIRRLNDPREINQPIKQWRSQPKIFAPKFLGAKSFDYKRATAFCLGHRLSKYKMTRYARNSVGNGPLGSPHHAGRALSSDPGATPEKYSTAPIFGTTCLLHRVLFQEVGYLSTK